MGLRLWLGPGSDPIGDRSAASDASYGGQYDLTMTGISNRNSNPSAFVPSSPLRQDSFKYVALATSVGPEAISTCTPLNRSPRNRFLGRIPLLKQPWRPYHSPYSFLVIGQNHMFGGPQLPVHCFSPSYFQAVPLSRTFLLLNRLRVFRHLRPHSRLCLVNRQHYH